MTIKDKTTGEGGNRGYKMVRSKYLKGPDGHGRVITAAREALIAKNGGKDPGENVVAAHKNFGAHHGDDQVATWQSRSWNTAESNMNRKDGISATDKLKLKSYNKKKDAKKLTEKFNDRRKHKS